MNDRKLLSPKTRFVHQLKWDPPPGNEPLVRPIHQSVKYIPADMAHFRRIMGGRNQGYIYSRLSNPTVRELELTLAELQGRDDALATASGIAALTAVAMTFLKAGDRVVIFTESYKPTRILLGQILKRFGVEAIRVRRDDYQTFEKICREKNPPKLVFLESPTNPCLRIHDLEWLTKTAKAAGCFTLLDNTFAGFLAHGEYEIDFFVHSLTKQASGHSDAMGGIIIAKPELIDAIFPIATTLGACLDPNSAWLISRGMKTYGLRVRESSHTAHQLAGWLSQQKWAENVIYPSLPTHQDYALWKKQNKDDGGSVITFDLGRNTKSTDQFFEALRVFSVTPSLGCVESLAVPCLQLYGDDLSLDEAEAAGINARTVRLAIGIEHIDDLQSDLLSAIAAAQN